MKAKLGMKKIGNSYSKVIDGERARLRGGLARLGEGVHDCTSRRILGEGVGA